MFLAIIMSISACSSNETNEIVFHKEIKMDKWVVNPVLADCYNPWDIQVVDSLLFICEPKTAYPFIKVYDKNSFRKVGAFGQQGNGPNEFLNASFIQIDKNYNMLWFVDFPTHTFHGFDIGDVLDTTKVPFPAISIQFDALLLPTYDFSIMPDTTIIVSTGIGNSLLTIINKNGGVVDSIGISPDKRLPIPNIAFNDFYYRYTVYSEKQRKIVCAYRYLDKILLYDMNVNKTKQLFGEDYVDYIPDVRGEGNIANNHIGYFGLKESGDCLYALYMGGDYHNQDITRNYPHEIQVFDWNLKPLVKLTFPDPIIDYAVKDSMLYLLVANRPNPLLVYQLDKKAW